MLITYLHGLHGVLRFFKKVSRPVRTGSASIKKKVKTMRKTVILADDELTLKKRQIWVFSHEGYELVGSYVTSLSTIAKVDWSNVDVVHIDDSMIHWTVLAELLLKYNPELEIVFFSPGKALNGENGPSSPPRTFILRSTDMFEACAYTSGRENNGAVGEKKLFGIRCFGGLSLSVGREPVIFRTRKAEEIIAFLADRRRGPVMRDVIIDALWPEMDVENAINNFHVNLYNIRSVLNRMGLRNLIIQSKGSYYLNGDLVRCDLWEFTDAVERLGNADPGSIEMLEAALRLYTGQYLAVEDYPWAQNTQMKLEHDYEELVNRTYEIYMEKGHYKKAVRAARSVIETDPLNLEAYRKCILAYISLHDIEAAVSCYKEIETKYREELGEKLPAAMQGLRNTLLTAKNRRGEALLKKSAV